MPHGLLGVTRATPLTRRAEIFKLRARAARYRVKEGKVLTVNSWILAVTRRGCTLWPPCLLKRTNSSVSTKEPNGALPLQGRVVAASGKGGGL